MGGDEEQGHINARVGELGERVGTLGVLLAVDVLAVLAFDVLQDGLPALLQRVVACKSSCLQQEVTVRSLLLAMLLPHVGRVPFCTSNPLCTGCPRMRLAGIRNHVPSLKYWASVSDKCTYSCTPANITHNVQSFTKSTIPDTCMA